MLAHKAGPVDVLMSVVQQGNKEYLKPTSSSVIWFSAIGGATEVEDRAGGFVPTAKGSYRKGAAAVGVLKLE